MHRSCEWLCFITSWLLLCQAILSLVYFLCTLYIYYFVFRIFGAVFMYVLSYFMYVLSFMAIFAWFDKTCDFSFILKGLRSGGIPLYRSSQLCCILRNDELVKDLVSFSLVTLCSFNPLLSLKLSLPPWCLIHVVFHDSMPFRSIIYFLIIF